MQKNTNHVSFPYRQTFLIFSVSTVPIMEHKKKRFYSWFKSEIYTFFFSLISTSLELLSTQQTSGAFRSTFRFSRIKHVANDITYRDPI